MKWRVACAFLIAILVLALAPLNHALAQKDSKNSSANGEATKADPAKPPDDKAAPKPADVKPGTPQEVNGQIVLNIVNQLLAPTSFSSVK